MTDTRDGIEIAIRVGNAARSLLQAFGMSDAGMVRVVLNETGKQLAELDKRLEEMEADGNG